MIENRKINIIDIDKVLKTAWKRGSTASNFYSITTMKRHNENSKH